MKDTPRTIRIAPALWALLLAAFVAALAFAGASIAPQQAFAAQDVYLNGQTGNDANAGTADAPVKTFAKAKELYQQNGASDILVSGRVTISGDETWDLGGGTVKRAPGYLGVIASPWVPGTTQPTFTLSNIVIDGGYEDGVKATGSLVDSYGFRVVITDGAVLQNNYYVDDTKSVPLLSAGGAVNVNNDMNAVLEMNGGTIKNNTSVMGGGVHIGRGTFYMTGGTIENNHAKNPATFNQGQNTNGGTGGGVCIYFQGKMKFSGGTIQNNTADYAGGGISVGGSDSDPDGGSVPNSAGQDLLTMTGGSILNNSADDGGGIFVQAGVKKGQSSIGNIPYDSWTQADISGGDISGNTSGLAGGGYSACPTSVTDIEVTDGSLFHGNTSTQSPESNELSIQSGTTESGHNGSPTYTISPVMLGGGAYHWVNPDGTETTLNQLHGQLSEADSETLSLSNTLTDASEGMSRGKALTKVTITNNTATLHGGGIASNGTVNIGVQDPETSAQVTKVWDDDDDAQGARPDTIDFDFLANGSYVGHQTMTKAADGTWAPVTVTNLPSIDADGNACTYTVVEHAVEGYDSTVTGDQTAGFTVTNTKTKEPSVPDNNNNQEPKHEQTNPTPASDEPEQPQQTDEEQPEESDETPETSDAANGIAGIFGAAALAAGAVSFGLYRRFKTLR